MTQELLSLPLSLQRYVYRYAVYRKKKHIIVTLILQISAGVKKQKRNTVLKHFRQIKLSVGNYWKISCLFIFYSRFWFTHTLLGNIQPVSNWILLAIPLCQYSQHQFCLIHSLLLQIYSSSWVMHMALFFIPDIKILNCAKNIQHASNIYTLFHVDLAPFSAWNGFGRRSRGSIWQVEDRRREPLGLRTDLTQQGCDGMKKGIGKLKQFGVKSCFPASLWYSFW